MYCNNIVIPYPQLMFIHYTLLFVLYAHRLSSLLLINYYLLTYLLTYIAPSCPSFPSYTIDCVVIQTWPCIIGTVTVRHAARPKYSHASRSNMHAMICVHAHRSQKRPSYKGAKYDGSVKYCTCKKKDLIFFNEWKSMTGSRDPSDPAWIRPCKLCKGLSELCCLWYCAL